MLPDMAARLWAVASLLRGGATDQNTLNHCGEVCDDIAIQLAKLAGKQYDDLREAADKETLQPSHKFSK